MSRESDEYYEYRDDLYSRLYIDAHLCRPECGDLGVIAVSYTHLRAHET